MVPDVHQSIEECACGDDDSLGAYLHAPYRLHTDGLSVLHYELLGLVLPDVEVRCAVDDASPFPYKLFSVTLGAGRPHGRSFTFVEHPELDSGGIGDEGHLSAKGVDLPHDLTFGNASHGRVATHLRNLVHVHGDEQCPGSDVCRRARRFAARVASTNHYHIVFKIHVLVFSAKVRNKFDFLFVLL